MVCSIMIFLRNLPVKEIMKPIFLIGFMGVGKTTLGRALAASRGLEFVDLDRLIEAREGRAIRRIFAEDGEERFRMIERDALAEAATRRDAIVACGGGTPCFHGNMDLMNASGLTVRLTARPDVLLRRLSEQQASRPLLDGLDRPALERFIARAEAAREPYYSLAPARFDASALESPAQVERSVNRFISEIIDKNIHSLSS